LLDCSKFLTLNKNAPMHIDWAYMLPRGQNLFSSTLLLNQMLTYECNCPFYGVSVVFSMIYSLDYIIVYLTTYLWILDTNCNLVKVCTYFACLTLDLSYSLFLLGLFILFFFRFILLCSVLTLLGLLTLYKIWIDESHSIVH
jgi:hypothetical protein